VADEHLAIEREIGPNRRRPRAKAPAPAKAVLQNMVSSPNPTPLEEGPCLVPDRQRGLASAETFLKQTGTGVTALGRFRFGPVSRRTGKGPLDAPAGNYGYRLRTKKAER
jgi:hypothetical protein